MQLQAARDLRKADRCAEALGILDDLARQHPANARVHEERGHCLHQLGRPAEALDAFQTAVYHNDTLEESWRAIQDLAARMRLPSPSESAVLALQRLARLPSAVVNASSLLNEGRLDEAESSIRQFLQNNGPHPAAMRVLAQIAVKMRVLDDAEMLLENVVRMDPLDLDARFEFATVLLQRRRFAPALAEARALLAADRSNLNYRRLYAQCCDGAGMIDAALAVYRKLLEEDPSNAEVRIMMAYLLRTSGDLQESISQFQIVAGQSAAGFAKANWGLASLKTYQFSPTDIELLRRAEGSGTSDTQDRYSLCFALGKALEDQHEYAESFECYRRGNALKRSELRYDSTKSRQQMLDMASICTRSFFAERNGWGCPDPDPIFIVGMPRSGSTLLEQILASHSMVDGTLELPDIPRLTNLYRARQGSSRPGYPANLPLLEPAQVRELGETYLDETRIHRRGAPFFIDKLPNNFRDIGFIHLILPNARIIDARRGAMACCFGNFKHLFAAGQEFSYDLREVGDYYGLYRDLMDHWDQVLPGKVLHVQYESVVTDLESNVRRTLEFCGLEFEPACLEFHRSARRVRTVSSEQVRQPIYREGVDQWKHYAEWLGPLKEALGPRCDG